MLIHKSCNWVKCRQKNSHSFLVYIYWLDDLFTLQGWTARWKKQNQWVVYIWIDLTGIRTPSDKHGHWFWYLSELQYQFLQKKFGTIKPKHTTTKFSQMLLNVVYSTELEFYTPDRLHRKCWFWKAPEKENNWEIPIRLTCKINKFIIIWSNPSNYTLWFNALTWMDSWIGWISWQTKIHTKDRII